MNIYITDFKGFDHGSCKRILNLPKSNEHFPLSTDHKKGTEPPNHISAANFASYSAVLDN